MIEAEHQLVIEDNIQAVWQYVQDIRNWALLFPGCQHCEVIDEHRSNWLLKVGAGGLVKTVDVEVEVLCWQGPERVEFSYALVSEPVVGRGFYQAEPAENGHTRITLSVQVEGSGKMAPMWEAVSKPLLPKMAKSFSEKIKAKIESGEASDAPLDADCDTAQEPSKQSSGIKNKQSSGIKKLWHKLAAKQKTDVNG